MVDARPMSQATIRRATPADTETLRALACATFVETFGHLYPPEDLRAFLEAAYAEDRARGELSDPAQAIWLAEADGRAVGYAHVGPCKLPHEDVTPACGELKRLYVLKTEQGSGLGGQMLKLALDWLERPGRLLWIGVWSENHGALRLYGRHGFVKVGEYEFPVGRVRDRELILRRG